VYDPHATFAPKVNYEMVSLQELGAEDAEFVHRTLIRHRDLTGSTVAAAVVEDWEHTVGNFRKVMPTDYERVLTVMEESRRAGLGEDETVARVMESARG